MSSGPRDTPYDFAPHGHLHRRRQHGGHRHFHQPRISSGRRADRFRHHGDLDRGRHLRALRRALVCGAGRGASAVGRRISFSRSDLPSGAGVPGGMDLGHRRVRRAGGDRRHRLRHLSRRSGAGIEPAPPLARGGDDLHDRVAARSPARQRVSERLDHSEDRAHRRDRHSRLLRGIDAARLVSSHAR